ncbi:MAG: cohesin domain-containing protein [Candidatus Jordarchaeaceae archaeon]
MVKKLRHVKANLLMEKLCALILCIFLVISSQTHTSTVTAEETSNTTIFTDPLIIQTTEPNESLTVNINISNVVDLYAWQAGITFNPNILECTGFYEGDFLRNGSMAPTIFVEHYKDMDNMLGIVYFRGCCLLGPVQGVNGSGQLAYMTFKSIGIGVSELHLTDIILLNSKLEDIEFEVVESLNVFLSGTNHLVEIVNNLKGLQNAEQPPVSGIFGTSFSMDDKEISFNIMSESAWFCQVNVPKSILTCSTPSDWTIKLNGTPISYTANENATHTSLYFEYDKGNYSIEIVGKEIPSEPPPAYTPSPSVPPLVLAATALLGFFALTVALLDFKKTRRLTWYQAADTSTNSFI